MLPDGVYWAVDNENNAAITSDGVLTALKNDETITVYLMLGDEILATKTVTTVTPTSIYFSRTNVNVIYGQGYELPIIARFGNKKVAFNTDDINFKLSNNKAGAVEGFTFVGNENSGVKNVIAKCANEMQQKILLRVGADQVVFPENESGTRLAKNLLSSGFIDMISLSKDVSMVEIDVKDEWCGKNLIELNLRKKYGFNIVAIKKGEKVNVNINPEQVLDSETTLIVIANTAKLGKLK